MTALTQDRNTPAAPGDIRERGVAASTLLYAGAIVMRNATGYTVNDGATATGLVGVGRAEERVDNSAGAAGDLTVKCRPGIYRFGNSASSDAITIADIGDALLRRRRPDRRQDRRHRHPLDRRLHRRRRRLRRLGPLRRGGGPELPRRRHAPA